MDQAVVTAIPETFTWMSSALGPSLALLNLGQNLYQAAGQQAYTRLRGAVLQGSYCSSRCAQGLCLLCLTLHGKECSPIPYQP